MSEASKMFKRVYIEITNVCNLNCFFCPGTIREKRFMSTDEFRTVCSKIRDYTDYIYLHVMGEPLLHPELDKILSIAADFGFHINITSNGILLKEKSNVLLGCTSLRKLSVSLHSFEGNNLTNINDYLDNVFDFCIKSDCIVSLRLWNGGGADSKNDYIISYLAEKYGTSTENLLRNSNGYKISDKTYIELADKFDWPSINSESKNVSYCYGMITQFAVLCDGTVVPCCLDSDGTINLGNIFSDNLNEIISSDRVLSLQNGFRCRKPSEELCKHCGYAERF